MPWLQLKIQTTSEYVEPISIVLNLLGANSITLLDAANQPILEPPPGSTPIWQHDWVVGLFDQPVNFEQALTFIRMQYGDAALLNYVIEELPDQNWERAWLDNFKPMQFGQRLWICLSAYTPPDSEAVNITLDPGLAFGTGTHPTTALCLEWLDSNPPLQQTIIDYGCGSGILAIAALKLGAREAWAIDYDEQALEATRDNAERNQINLNTLKIALPEQLPNQLIDLLIANILAAPIIELAEQFAGFVKPGGKIVLSGILAEQTDHVIAAYQNKFTLSAPKQKEAWILLEGIRR